jgi:hypothetical protein
MIRAYDYLYIFGVSTQTARCRPGALGNLLGMECDGNMLYASKALLVHTDDHL